jgi:hypothetical protein
MIQVHEENPGALRRRSVNLHRLRTWIAVAAMASGLTVGRSLAQTAADPTRFGLPGGAQENVGGRTESSKEFALPDGTSARLLFSHPLPYQDASGQ